MSLDRIIALNEHLTNLDRITALSEQLRVAEAVRDDARAECQRLLDENRALKERAAKHLELIARLSQSAPLDSEIAEALEQRGKLLAEIGSLRAQLAERDRG